MDLIINIGNCWSIYGRKLWTLLWPIKEQHLICLPSGSALDIDPAKVTVAGVINIMGKVYVDDNDLIMKCDEFDQLLRKRDRCMKEFIHVYEQKVNELKARGGVNFIFSVFTYVTELLKTNK